MRNTVISVALVAILIGSALVLTALPGCQNGETSDAPVSEPLPVPTSDITDLSIAVVYDNYQYSAGLRTEWGFACVVRGAEKTILFDTGGDGDILLANMEKMGISPAEIDLVVLSHIHGDHVGGLDAFIEKNPNVTVYIPNSFPADFGQDAERRGAKMVRVQQSQQICDSVYSTGELGTSIKEQSLAVYTTKGLIVITGCAHPGIVQIVEKAKGIVNDDVLLVMGGFHLGNASTATLENIVSDFRELGVLHVGPCHCSGDTTRSLFAEEYGERYIDVGVGRVISLSGL